MASLAKLKGMMWLTIILVFGIGFALLSVILYILNVSLIFSVIAVLFFVLLQWLISPAIVSASARLRYLQKGENLWLEQTVAELASKANVPIPRLAVVPDPSPNAFVFGRTRGSSTLAVHQGLLDSLNKDEIKGVLAHEIGHVRHNDCVVMTLVSAIPLLAYIIARGTLEGGVHSGSSSDSKGGAGALIAIAIMSWIIYFLSQLMVQWLSRSREYYADAFSAYSTKDPHSLMSALSKITYGLSVSKKQPSGLRAFYIEDDTTAKKEIGEIMKNKNKYDLDSNGVLDENELTLAMKDEAKNKWVGINELFSTHPATFKRIFMLDRIDNELETTIINDKTIYKLI